MLADNILLLKKDFPQIYNQVKEWEESGEKKRCIIEKAKDGTLTEKWQDGDKAVYIHSKYNPVCEADTIVGQLAENEEIAEETYVLFFGIGLGYHIESFCKRYPNTAFSIIEPSVEILYCFLENKLMKGFSTKQLEIIKLADQITEIFDESILNRNRNLVICELPVYKKIFENEYLSFLRVFKNKVKEERLSLNTNYAFKERWIINCVNNLRNILVTPNILMDHNDVFKDKKVILVSAGPSLDFEIENLRKIKNEGKAYIFAVGSSISTLLKNEIYPHVVCTYDPTVLNQKVYEQIHQLNIKSIPMIFGSSTGYESVEQYPGDKFHMVTSQDTISKYLLSRSEGEQLEIINDAPSIAVVTLELLARLGVKTVYLVGQNLAYLNNKNYASGITYAPDINEEVISIKDVMGENVNTDEAFVTMKKLLEYAISKYKICVVNTTIGGARIEGTQFKKLSEVMTNDILNENTQEDIFEKIVSSHKYDKNFLNIRMNKISEEYEDFKSILKKINHYLSQIKQLIMISNKKQAKANYYEMDKVIRKLEQNDFFKMVALPINRVEYIIFAKKIQQLRLERNEIRRIKSLLDPINSIINLFYTQYDTYESILLVLQQTITNYINGEK